jgi:hypothetical protein
MSILSKLFGKPGGSYPNRGDVAYSRAMKASDELLATLREHEEHTDAARSIIFDIWKQARNIPFMTTVYEAVQEAKSGPEVSENRRYAIMRNGGGRHRMAP